MKPFQMIAEWLRKHGWLTKQYSHQPIVEENKGQARVEKPSAVGPTCPHGKTEGTLEIIILGVKCNLITGSPMCPVCTEQYLNKFSTLCAACGRPIFPGDPVGLAWDGAPHPFTHLYYHCCDSGGLYCGVWGEGRLITLHELKPEKYPPGTASIVSHILQTKRPAIENVA